MQKVEKGLSSIVAMGLCLIVEEGASGAKVVH